MINYLEKVVASLAGGDYFFVFLKSSTNNVTMIARIIITMESNSKSLIKCLGCRLGRR